MGRIMARKKTIKRKHQAWNKGLKVGKRSPFSPSDVGRIRKLLAKRGESGLRDLALFSTAMDTMLGASDLVRLTVQDVRKRNRVVRETLELSKTNGGGSLRCVISETTRRLLEKWIKYSNKKPRDNLFSRRVGGESTAISTRALSRLVKAWAEEIGLDASLYGTESLRRTRAVYLLNRTGNVEAVRILLGLRTISATAQYLSDSKPVDALAISRAHEI